MKKIIFVLVVLLLAVPAWATTVTITATQVGTTDQVEIKYVSVGNLPRAFGLDITVTDGNIVACEPNMVGECTADVKGYGIFPGTIVIEADGTVSNDGTPVAPPGATGALGGIDTNGITIEMGSLYVDGNAPPLEGVLCTITVTKSCTVKIAGNAARCGTGSALGVVMENPDEVIIETYVPGGVIIPSKCLVVGQVVGGVLITQDMYDLWVVLGEPLSWCYDCHYRCDTDGDCDVDGIDVGVLVNGWSVYDPRADTDNDGDVDGIDVGNMVTGWNSGCGPCTPIP